MGMQNGGQRLGLQRCGTRVKTQTRNATGRRDSRLAPGYGRPQAPHQTWLEDRLTSHLSGLSCFLYKQTEVAAFALPGRCSGVTGVISARQQMFLAPLSPTTQIYHRPLFRGVRASGMRATAAVKQTSDRLIASVERQVTIIPLTIGLLSDGR